MTIFIFVSKQHYNFSLNGRFIKYHASFVALIFYMNGID